MRNHGILLPVAALGSPGQSAHSAAYENASCPSLGAANKNGSVNFSYTNLSTQTTFHLHFKDKEFLTVEARRGALHTAPSMAGPVWVTMLLGLQEALLAAIIPVNTRHVLTTNAEPMLQLLCRFFCSPTWQNLSLEVKLIGQRLRLFGS